MFASFNGYILATSKTPQVMIDIYEDGKSKFFRDDATDKNTSLNVFKCSHLKKYICDKIGVDSNEADEVELWRVNVNKEKIKKDFNENDIENKLKGTLMEDNKLFKGYFKDELARADNGEDDESVENIHIITVIPTPTSTNLGRKRKAVQDISTQILDEFRKRPRTTLPDVKYLKDHIDRELDIKIPLRQHEFDGLISLDLQNPCSADDLKNLFRISETESAYRLCGSFYGAAIFNDPPQQDGTEYSFVNLWDCNIRVPLEFLICNSKSVRNSSKHTSTGSDCPNYGLILANVCPFRGEEKSPTNKKDPKEELASKLVWTYDPAPYVLGYYAIGPYVTLVAICRPEDGCNKPTVIDLASLNLALKRDRIYHFQRLINLSKIIEELQELIGPREMPEYIAINRGNRCIITMEGTTIKKNYICPDAWIFIEKLKNIYHKLEEKKVPNVDHIRCVAKEQNTVYLFPRGSDKKPADQQELLEAIICILEALVVLHDGDTPIYHRDIRWPNIIKQINIRPNEPTKWFIIDWEDAVGHPNDPGNRLSREEHAPEVFLPNHRGEVDIWGVGKLIVDAIGFILGLSQSIIKFGRDMQSNNRPSAKEALERIKEIKETLNAM